MPFLRGNSRRRSELTLAPFLEVKELWHRYGSSGLTLQNIDFSLESGQLLGLLGPSGCGKTTLLRLIAGFERPSQGLISIAGREVASTRRWLAPERRQVGMLFQDYALFPHLSALDNVAFGLRGLGRAEKRKAALARHSGTFSLPAISVNCTRSAFAPPSAARHVSGRNTIGASSPLAPCTVIMRTAPPPASISRLMS